MVVSVRVAPVKIHAKQAEFRRSTVWQRGYCGGRGSGKTKIGCLDILLRAKDGEPYMAISPTYKIISDTTWPIFEETARELGVWLKGTWSPVPRVTFLTQDGGRANVTFRSGEDPESLRGPSKAGLWLDEASIMHKSVFDIGIAVLRFKGRMGWVSMTFTPKGRRHWTYEAFFERQKVRQPDGFEVEKFLPKANTHLVQSDTRANPFLPGEFYGLVRSRYSSTLAAQELGGEFVEIEGLMFRREDFQRARAVPRGDCLRVRYWDKAATFQAGAHTVGLLLAIERKTRLIYVEDIQRGQWSVQQRDAIILDTATRDAEKYGNEVQIVCEQEPGSGGKESMQATVRMLLGFPVHRDVVGAGRQFRTVRGEVDKKPGAAKVIRAQPIAAQVEARNVYLVDGDWREEFLAEVCAFPEYAFADQVDALSGAFNWAAKFIGVQSDGPSRSDGPGAEPQRHGVLLNGNGDNRYERFFNR